MARFINGFGFAILLVTTPALAQSGKPDWVSVSDLAARYYETDDYTYLSNALYRCSALNSVFGAVLTRDGLELGNSLTDTSFTQLLLGNMYGALKQIARGADVDIDAAASDMSVAGSDMYQAMLKNYIAWMTDNYVNYGDYTSEPDYANEVTTCARITKDVSDDIAASQTSPEPAIQSETRAANLVEDLAKLQDLHDQGVLDDEEFNAAKRRLLGL